MRSSFVQQAAVIAEAMPLKQKQEQSPAKVRPNGRLGQGRLPAEREESSRPTSLGRPRGGDVRLLLQLLVHMRCAVDISPAVDGWRQSTLQLKDALLCGGSGVDGLTLLQAHQAALPPA